MYEIKWIAGVECPLEGGAERKRASERATHRPEREREWLVGGGSGLLSLNSSLTQFSPRTRRTLIVAVVRDKEEFPRAIAIRMRGISSIFLQQSEATDSRRRPVLRCLRTTRINMQPVWRSQQTVSRANGHEVEIFLSARVDVVLGKCKIGGGEAVSG